MPPQPTGCDGPAMLPHAWRLPAPPAEWMRTAPLPNQNDDRAQGGLSLSGCESMKRWLWRWVQVMFLLGTNDPGNESVLVSSVLFRAGDTKSV